MHERARAHHLFLLSSTCPVPSGVRGALSAHEPRPVDQDGLLGVYGDNLPRNNLNWRLISCANICLRRGPFRPDPISVRALFRRSCGCLRARQTTSGGPQESLIDAQAAGRTRKQRRRFNSPLDPSSLIGWPAGKQAHFLRVASFAYLARPTRSRAWLGSCARAPTMQMS